MRKHQRETEKVNEGEHLKEQVTDKGKKSKAIASDQALDDNDWAEKALNDDDTRSINNFEDEDEDERVRCPEFNEKTAMSNPQLCKGMKFPNGKFFKAALREYAVKTYIFCSLQGRCFLQGYLGEIICSYLEEVD